MTPLVMHVITGLATGGAETMLMKLVRSTDATQFANHVVSLTDRGTRGGTIEEHGVPVDTLGMSRTAAPAAVLRLARLIRQARPAVVVSWMYHANAVALAARGLARAQAPLLWNIRHTPYSMRAEKRLTAALIYVSAALSPVPAGIIYNAHVSLRRHRELGFRSGHTAVIPNGFDLSEFTPSTIARQRIREELGIPADVPVVGHVARFHPMKDHASFLRAAGTIGRQLPAARFIMAGRDVTTSNARLVQLCEAEGLAGRVGLIGERRDVPAVLAALDVLCLSSAWGEGFPNVLGEAMACGVVCVTTDVGDSGAIVGDTGRLVPRGEPAALASACVELLQIDRAARERLGQKARERVREHYSLERVARLYESEYRAVLSAERSRPL